MDGGWSKENEDFLRKIPTTIYAGQFIGALTEADADRFIGGSDTVSSSDYLYFYSSLHSSLAN